MSDQELNYVYRLIQANPYKEHIINILNLCDDTARCPVVTGIVIKREAKLAAPMTDKIMYLLSSLQLLAITHVGPASVYQLTQYGDALLNRLRSEGGLTNA